MIDKIFKPNFCSKLWPVVRAKPIIKQPRRTHYVCKCLSCGAPLFVTLELVIPGELIHIDNVVPLRSLKRLPKTGDYMSCKCEGNGLIHNKIKNKTRMKIIKDDTNT